jgi:peptide/nickel transport system substrate-binding protein/microcin C transport system substrate-binding protein
MQKTSSRRRRPQADRRRILALGATLLASPPWALAEGAVAPSETPADSSASSGPAITGVWTHGYAAFGAPKYPKDFNNFGYVDPDAPKGGTLYLRNSDRRNSFDKFNYFTTKGVAPAGLAIYMLEGLAVLAGDEPMTMYGLLAEEMLVAPDKSSITFRLNPKARFYNGDPVTAEDVRYSFESLSGKRAHPEYQTKLAGVERAVVLDARTIRFDLRERSNDTLFTIGITLRVFSPKWALGPDGKPRPFDEIVNEFPITTGPYTIGAQERPRVIEFKRNPDYWARDLPVRRGFFNFDRVVYRLFKDNDVGREAFKAGEFDIYREYSGRAWVRLHKGPKWDDGRIKKDPFETAFGQGLQSYNLNTRLPKFQDRRVREAFTLTYDFEMTINRFGQYTRADSMFSNSTFAAKGLPSPGELKLLEPFRKELPPEVFGPPYVAPRTNGDPKLLRKNLLRARDLFAAAGWKVASDGRLRNAAGEAFEVEYMIATRGSSTLPEWRLNVEKLGGTLRIREVDFALFQRRLEAYDFDMTVIVEGQFTLPQVNELISAYSSKAADEKGNNNFRGIKSAAVDHLLDTMSKATTLEQLRDAARALDRVVMWNFYQVPDLYLSRIRASYWDKFGMPAKRPLYYTVESAIEEYPAWPITTWWIKDPAKRQPGQ